MSATPTLSAPGIILRPLVVGDAPALFLALSDPEVQRYRRDGAHLNVDETRNYIETTLARSRAAWAITEDCGEALGRLALREPQPGTGEFGIVIRRAAQGRGLGAKAIRLASDYAFSELGMGTLLAEIDSENHASLALFSRQDYQPEATPPAHRDTHLGVRDMLLFAKKRAGPLHRG